MHRLFNDQTAGARETKMDFGSKQSLARRLGCAASLSALAAMQGAHAAPVEKILYDFGVVQGGRNPQAAPILGPDGVYYGTTTGGGATGNGTVYRLVPPAGGQAGSRRVIYSFSGVADGSVPSSGLLVGKDGALYGVTSAGGAQGYGTAFKLSPPVAGQAEWAETTLHSFNGSTDGNAPSGTLVQDANGILYGSTAGGGSGSGGVVFSLTPPASGQAAWTETVLYSFVSGTDGVSPTAGVFLEEATGDIYGMTSLGGLNGVGQIYRLTPPSAGGSSYSKTSLYAFRAITDGNYPVGGLVRGADGTFYGVTDAGGLSGWGTVFSFTPPEGNRPASEEVIYHFSGRLDGGAPDATPILAPDGTLYGVTNAGGNVGSGAAFALTPPAKGRTWHETALASFDGPNGLNPAGLSLDPSGFLIGTTFYGGTASEGGGTIFELTPPASGASAWTQSVLYDLPEISDDAVTPQGALLMGRNGVLYGSANGGGANGQGAVYELTPPASGQTAWKRSILHSFTGTDGAEPTGKLLQGPNGVLFGVTSSGGSASGNAYGTVYALVPPAAGKTGWTEQVLHAFTGVATGDGSFPAAGLIADAQGALYGTAGSGGIASGDDSYGNGIVFKLTPPAKGQGAWQETILYSFTGPDGSTPQGTLLSDPTGALYGTTYTGGPAGEGTVFKLTPPVSGTAWSEAVLHGFNASVGNDGAIPGTEQLVMDAHGTLYGTASQGGAGNMGVVFALSPPAPGGTDWTETLLHSFTGPDGSFPYVGLLPNKAGALLGVAGQGGISQYDGTVFELTPPATGAAWAFKVLHSFNPSYGQDGAGPAGALVKDAKGNLYGTTAGGGFGGGGIVFELTH